MRNLKFRAWSGKQMFNHDSFDGIAWKHLRGDFSNPVPFNFGWEEDFFEKDYVIMLYTGLKDKNGVEIYESDIVDGGKYGKGKIIWRGSGWMIEYYDKDQYLKYDYLSLAIKDPIEVTGSIYESK